MKKLLVILLLFPKIGFGQTQDPLVINPLIIFLLIIIIIIINILFDRLRSIRKKIDESHLHYEGISKSINDLTQDLKKKSDTIDSLKQDLKKKSDTIDSLKQELKYKEREEAKRLIQYKEAAEERVRIAKVSPEELAAEELEKKKNLLIGFIDNIDDLFYESAVIVMQHQSGSTSFIQRKLKIGYNRAGRIIDQLEAAGVIGPFKGSKARAVVVKNKEELLSMYAYTIKLTYDLKLTSKEKANILWRKLKDFYESKGWINEWSESEEIID